MKAEKLVVISDTHGIRTNPSDPASLVRHLTIGQIDDLVKSGVITSGMLPKVEACVTALSRWCEQDAHHRRPIPACAAFGNLYRGGDWDGNC